MFACSYEIKMSSGLLAEVSEKKQHNSSDQRAPVTRHEVLLVASELLSFIL